MKEQHVDYDQATGRMRSPPRQIFLEVSSRCNLACVHCSRDFGSPYGHPARDMSFETVKRLAPWLEAAHHVNLNMVGESLLAPDFDRILCFASGRGTLVHFNTNGILMNEPRCRLVVERQVHSVVFSVDGDASNFPIRGVSYAAVKRRMLLLDRVKRELGSDLPHIGVSFVLMRRNLHELPQVLEDLCGLLRVHAIHVQPLVVFWETLRGENVYDQEDVDDVVSASRAIAARHGSYLGLFRSQFGEDERNRTPDETPQLGAHSDRFGCIDPFYEIKIRSTGEVMSCSYGLTGGLDIGRDSLDGIWNGPWYRALRQRLYARCFEGRCANCAFIRGSRENQVVPLQPGVHHSRADRFVGPAPALGAAEIAPSWSGRLSRLFPSRRRR